MDLIILNDGLYSLVPVTKQMLEDIKIIGGVDCFDLCDILRLKLTTYHEAWNAHIMNDGSGDFYGCMCR
jgi:NADP-dependent 3-hydroxy acid dehydrogenase YdfG